MLILGTSLELGMVGSVRKHHEDSGLAQFQARWTCGERDNIEQELSAALLKEEWDFLIYEIVLHESIFSCEQFEKSTLPIVASVLRKAQRRAQLVRGETDRPVPWANSVAKTAELADLSRRRNGVPLPHTIFLTGSYVQWALMDRPWRYAELLTNSYTLNFLNEMMYAFAHVRNLPVIGRVEPLASREDDTPDNVHYSAQSSILEWRLIINEICKDMLDQDTETAFSGEQFEPAPIPDLEGT